MGDHQHGDNDPRLGAEFWVPAQNQSGKVVGIEYGDPDKFIVQLNDGQQVTVGTEEVQQHPSQE